MTMLTNRYDFVLLFDVQDGNPNGDPDLGNQPRIDLETGVGLVTDVCLKRKVRNYVMFTKNGVDHYDIFIKEKGVLNRFISEEWDIDSGKRTPAEVKKAQESQKIESDARTRMCKRYFDVRTFGAVMSTGDKGAGQVRGPIQMTFSRSYDPIVVAEHCITRMAVTNEKDLEKERTMGRKYTVPYALYCAHGFVSPFLAAQTGFSKEDLELFWEALLNMFEFDRSAARGLMSTRHLVIFEHKSSLGNAFAESSFERIKCEKLAEIPRAFSDYKVMLDGERLTEIKKVVNVGA